MDALRGRKSYEFAITTVGHWYGFYSGGLRYSVYRLAVLAANDLCRDLGNFFEEAMTNKEKISALESQLAAAMELIARKDEALAWIDMNTCSFLNGCGPAGHSQYCQVTRARKALSLTLPAMQKIAVAKEAVIAAAKELSDECHCTRFDNGPCDFCLSVHALDKAQAEVGEKK